MMDFIKNLKKKNLYDAFYKIKKKNYMFGKPAIWDILLQ